jgi:hypothetical protein
MEAVIAILFMCVIVVFTVTMSCWEAKQTAKNEDKARWI